MLVETSSSRTRSRGPSGQTRPVSRWRSCGRKARRGTRVMAMVAEGVTVIGGLGVAVDVVLGVGVTVPREAVGVSVAGVLSLIHI